MRADQETPGPYLCVRKEPESRVGLGRETAISFSRESSRDGTWVSCIACRLFTTWATTEAQRTAKILCRKEE